MQTNTPSRKFFVRVTHNDGSWSVLKHRDRTEWTRRVAMKHADYVWNKHGLTAYVVPC